MKATSWTDTRCALLITVVALATAWPPAGHAQVMVSPALADKDAQAAGKSNKATKQNETQALTLWPAAEPIPAMRYRFWPAPEDRLAKNVMPMINRAVIFYVQANKFSNPKNKRTELFEKANLDSPELSLDELPRDEVQKYLAAYGIRVFPELERGENCMETHYDLDISRMGAVEIVSTLLPEFQEMRGVARMLNLRLRLAAAEGRWDDFQRDCRLSFRLAEAASRSTDFLVGRLVGIAIAGQATASIREAMQRPDCPNLYWALASIPDERLFETRESIEFDGTLISRLQGNEPLPRDPIGPETARRRLAQLVKSADALLAATGEAPKREVMQMLAGLYVVTTAPSARAALQETDQWRGRAAELSDPEVVLRYMHLRFSQLQDDWMKWSLLPPELATQFIDRQEQSMLRDASGGNVLESLVSRLAPAVKAASRAGVRARQDKSFLMTVEAIRMHTAARGELPNQLSDLEQVPAMTDPFTLKPFEYLRSSTTSAILQRAARYPGDDNTTFQIKLMNKETNE